MRDPYPIPEVVELLYHAWVPAPAPHQWPEELERDPVRGSGLFCFYQGLSLALQLREACRPD